MDIEPIPLTEYLLINNEFSKRVFRDGIRLSLCNVIDGTSDFEIWIIDGEFIPHIDGSVCCWSEFKYVHQLQNLYFALNGSELKLIDN